MKIEIRVIRASLEFREFRDSGLPGETIDEQKEGKPLKRRKVGYSRQRKALSVQLS